MPIATAKRYDRGFAVSRGASEFVAAATVVDGTDGGSNKPHGITRNRLTGRLEPPATTASKDRSMWSPDFALITHGEQL